jgi:hypothetical protein
MFHLVGASPAVGQNVRAMVAVHEALLENGLTGIERQQGLLRGTWLRVESESAALLEAHRQGEGLENLELREAQLQQIEAELLAQLFEAQRLRRQVLANQAVIEVARDLAPADRGPSDILTGTWSFTVQPGLTGTAYLFQQGTLVEGTYELSGEWAGSLRGTLVANKVRLERIDSKLGFAAIFYGELSVTPEAVVLQGRWEATQLAAGMASAGGWRAVRQD